MRPVSLFTIVLLCVLIVVIDALAFYWLQSITQLLGSPALVTAIHIVFWLFTIGLVSAIIILKLRLDSIDQTRRHRYISSFYGLAVSSFVPKLFFVISISILYGLNFVFSESESKLIVPLVGLLSGFLPFFIIVYSIFKTIYRFKVTTVNIEFDDLPKGFSGFSLVHISDLHLGSFNYRYAVLDKAIRLINNSNPDLICFTGDLVNNYAWELRGWDVVLRDLSASKGKFAVLGNHDYGDYSEWDTPREKQANLEAIKQHYKDTGFTLLQNEAALITSKNDKIAIVGVENWGTPPFKQYGDLNKALQKVEHIPFKVLLSHNPTHWQFEVLPKTNIALTLSGHTHGMQAGVQYKKLQWSPIKYKYKHWAGLYKEGSQYLYVNRGLGWIGLPARIGMRPEITIIKLVSTRN